MSLACWMDMGQTWPSSTPRQHLVGLCLASDVASSRSYEAQVTNGGSLIPTRIQRRTPEDCIALLTPQTMSVRGISWILEKKLPPPPPLRLLKGFAATGVSFTKRGTSRKLYFVHARGFPTQTYPRSPLGFWRCNSLSLRVLASSVGRRSWAGVLVRDRTRRCLLGHSWCWVCGGGGR